jgi:hypothetical protein
VQSAEERNLAETLYPALAGWLQRKRSRFHIGSLGSGGEAMTAATSSSQAARQGGDLADMSPAYFSLVMATGIVSSAAFMMEHRTLARQSHPAQCKKKPCIFTPIPAWHAGIIPPL